MNRKQLKRLFKLGIQYVPITINCILLVLVMLWLNHALNNQKATPDNPSSFAPFILLMGKTVLWFVFFLIGFSFLTSFLCFLYFLWIRRKQKEQFTLQFEEESGYHQVRWKASFGRLLRPFLGAVRCRLLYDEELLTSKLILLGNDREKGKVLRKGILGKQILSLPDIREYNLKGCFIYFEDWLRLFSFTGFIKQSGYFHQLPNSGKAQIETVSPFQVKEDRERVEVSRPVPGDYVNYKGFEGGDDIRRIVWQAYAKNRELMVRIPEMRDFYASHLDFYASFHTDLSEGARANSFSAEMLNYYKNRVWTTIKTLLDRGLPLKFKPDQPFGETDGSTEKVISLTLSSSEWQNNQDLDDYFPTRNHGILCISSFNNPEEVKDLLERMNHDSLLYFIPLSVTFHNFLGWNWIKRIFIKPETDRLKRIRTRWPFSPLKFKITKREKIILKLLEDHEIKYGVLK